MLHAPSGWVHPAGWLVMPDGSIVYPNTAPDPWAPEPIYPVAHGPVIMPDGTPMWLPDQGLEPIPYVPQHDHTQPIPAGASLPIPPGWPPPPYPFQERGSQGGEQAEHDTMRWGDESPCSVIVSAALVPLPFSSTTKQLVRARASEERPIVWLLQFNVGAAQVTPGELANYTITWTVIIGAGQSRSSFTGAQVILTAANGYQLPPGTIPPQLFVPALEVQVTATASISMATAPGTDVFYLGAMAAPFTRLER
jgi:hypothetical protein